MIIIKLCTGSDVAQKQNGANFMFLCTSIHCELFYFYFHSDHG